MARRKTAEDAQEVNDPLQAQEPQAESPAVETPSSGEVSEAPKSKWVSRFGSWGDYEAGVHLVEDRQNKLMTIKFDEKPSEAVLKLMKEGHGFRFEPEDQLWYKRINQARQRQSRAEAEQLAFTVANIIREDKGLEQKQPFSHGM